MDGLESLNSRSAEEAFALFLRCCGSTRWARAMERARPFKDKAALMNAAAQAEADLSREDWLEAFSHHPKIGGKDALRATFAATRSWAGQEQQGAAAASEDVLDALSSGNEDYARKFGYIFIICATGKTAGEMLATLRERLMNDPETELRSAAAEQSKITRLRLQKLLAELSA